MKVDEAKVNLGSARVANFDVCSHRYRCWLCKFNCIIIGLETGCCSCIMGYEDLKK